MAATTLRVIGQSIDDDELAIILHAWLTSHGAKSGTVFLVEAFDEAGQLLATREIHP